MKSHSHSITVVCFGDSLTAGYQSPTYDIPWLRETPYGVYLKERLGAQANVIIKGVCGEVTRDMVVRFPHDVLGYQPDYVVILGGTNDLGWQAQPNEIIRNLVRMYEQALNAGIQPIAVTVPSIRMDPDPAARDWLKGLITQRQDLNRLIAQQCAAKGMPCVDLFTATAEPNTWLLALPYSNDGLHLTTAGYRTMADLLYDHVFRDRLCEPA